MGGAAWAVFPYRKNKRFVKIPKTWRLRLDNIFFGYYNMFEN